MMIGTWLRLRSRRQTSMPSTRGSITSRTTRSNRCSANRSSASRPSCAGIDLVAVAAQRVGEQRLDRLLVVHQQDPRRGGWHGERLASVAERSRTRCARPPWSTYAFTDSASCPRSPRSWRCSSRSSRSPARCAPWSPRPGSTVGRRRGLRSPDRRRGADRPPGSRATPRPPPRREDLQVGDRRPGRRAALRRRRVAHERDPAAARARAETSSSLIAPRDTASPPGAASSAAATGALEELASSIGTSQHTKTIVLVSTDGWSEGASGARALVDGYLDPSSSTPSSPSSSRARRASASALRARLVDRRPERVDPARPHRRALAPGPGRAPRPRAGPFGQLAALALPGGLGEQAVLIARGIDAVGLSSAGERPLAPADDQLDDFSAEDARPRSAIGLRSGARARRRPGPPGPRAGRLPRGRRQPDPGLGARALALGAAPPAPRRGRRRPRPRGPAPRGGRGARMGSPCAPSRFSPPSRFSTCWPSSGSSRARRSRSTRGATPSGPPSSSRCWRSRSSPWAVWWSLGRNRMPVRMAPEAAAAALGL